MLQTEWIHYQKHKEAWVRSIPGRYVLLHDQSKVGDFANFREAVEAGYDRLGNVPFLVKRVQKDPPGELEAPL
jgi:hypothetical protein